MTNRYVLSGKIALVAGIFGGLYWISRLNYLLFHGLTELFSVIIAGTFFVIVWNSKSYLGKKFTYLEFIGIAYLFVAGLDFLHTLSFEGMGIFTSYDYYANQLWVGARYLESLSLLVPYLFLKFKRQYYNPYWTFVSYAVIFTLLVASIFWFKIFPICFIKGQGQTPFKIWSEFIIIFILLIDLYLLYRYRTHFEHTIHRFLFASIVFTIFSEMGFTIYTDNYGIANALGHLFKVVSFYLIYKAIIITCITEPYKTIFKELKDKEAALYHSAMKDDLTGLYNRRAAIELLEKVIKSAERRKESGTICFIDVDHLKFTNDTYGHVEGDHLLTTVANHLVKQVRNSDFVCRLGGDEFLLILPSTSMAESDILLSRIKGELKKYNDQNPKPYPVDFSYGLAEFTGQEPNSLDLLLEQADDRMYQNKSAKRRSAATQS